jgi:uncharacterized protein (TIGR00251 family)
MHRTTNSNLSRNSFSFLTYDKEGILLRLYIQPRASKSEITGIHAGTALKIRLTSPPVEGAANAACIEFLADIFGVKKNQIELVRGQKSRMKQIKIKGISLEEAGGKIFKYLTHREKPVSIKADK